MRLRLHETIGAGVIAATIIIGSNLSTSHHVAPSFLYPDPTYTSGAADTLDTSVITSSFGGQTYSQSHRNVTDDVKKQVYQEYGVSFPQPAGKYEVDHFYPLCAGGSNDIKNLWLQPAVNTWNGQDLGFHTKDKLEAYICEQIKAGKIDPKVAFQKMTSDWVAFYQSLNLSQKLGSISNETVE